MKNKRKGKLKYPSPEVYDHVMFQRKKRVGLKDKKIWYLAIALVALTVTLLAILIR